MDPANTVKHESKVVKGYVYLEAIVIFGLVVSTLIANTPSFNQPGMEFFAFIFAVPFSIAVFVITIVTFVATIVYLLKRRFTRIYLWLYSLQIVIWAIFAVSQLLTRNQI